MFKGVPIPVSGIGILMLRVFENKDMSDIGVEEFMHAVAVGGIQLTATHSRYSSILHLFQNRCQRRFSGRSVGVSRSAVSNPLSSSKTWKNNRKQCSIEIQTERIDILKRKSPLES